MTAAWVVLAGFSTTIGAVLAAALGNFSTPVGFMKYWAGYGVAIAGLCLLDAYGGIVMRSGLCATVWYAECG